MSYLSVFIPSLVFTLIVGALMLLWPVARGRRILAAYWSAAFVVHIEWLLIPQIPALAPVARWLAILWIAAITSALLLVVPLLLITLALKLLRRAQPAPAWPAAALLGLSLSIGIVGSISSTADFIVRQESVTIPGLPAALEGFRIGHLTDIHVGRFIDLPELERIIAATNEQRIDMLALTGDLVDDLDQLEDMLLAIERSRAAHVISVLGNHEKMGDLPRVLRAYERHAKRNQLLVDASLVVNHRGAALRVVGVDYPMNKNGSHMLPRPEQDAAMRAYAAKAFAEARPGETIVALSHHPDFFPLAAERGAHLTIAGHTHGGQVKLFGRPLIVAYDHMHGRYQRADSHLEVSAGAGHWLPLRLGVPREIVILTLRGAQPASKDLEQATVLR